MAARYIARSRSLKLTYILFESLSTLLSSARRRLVAGAPTYPGFCAGPSGPPRSTPLPPEALGGTTCRRFSTYPSGSPRTRPRSLRPPSSGLLTPGFLYSTPPTGDALRPRLKFSLSFDSVKLYPYPIII